MFLATKSVVATLRTMAADYIRSHRADFAPFLPTKNDVLSDGTNSSNYLFFYFYPMVNA